MFDTSVSGMRIMFYKLAHAIWFCMMLAVTKETCKKILSLFIT